MSDYLHRVGAAKFDQFGIATVSLGPDAPNQYWAPKLIHVSVNQTHGFSYNGNFTIVPPLCYVFHNQAGLTTPGTRIDATNNGFSDTTGLVSGTVVQFGDTISAQWQLGYAGDIAILNVYGEVAYQPPSVGIAVPEILGTGFVFPIPIDLPFERPQIVQDLNIGNPGPGGTRTIIPADPNFAVYLHTMEWLWNTTDMGAFGRFTSSAGTLNILRDNVTEDNPRYMDFKGISLPFGEGLIWRQDGGTAANTVFMNGSLTYAAGTG